MVTADTHALFTPLKPSVERGGQRLGDDSFADPSPGLLEALLGQREASQQLICLWKQEEVRGGEIRRKGWVGDHRDGDGGEPVLGGGGIDDWKFVPAPISVKNSPDG